MDYTYKTEMVCSQEIIFHIEGNVITNISFYGGCNGNLKAISKLCDGMTVEQIEEKLKGNLCGRRPTSCPDQLSKILKQVIEASREQA